MRPFSFRRAFRGSLRNRIIILTLCGFVAVAVPAYFGFTTLVNSTIEQLGTLFAEKQILFDRARGRGVLLQEVTLAETLTRSPVLAEWARDEADPAKKARAIAELEQYRQSFSAHSYFFVVNGSGNYYYNDAADTHAADPYSYTLNRANPRDGWYYTTAAMGAGCHLNVDHDDALKVTNVWINCVIHDGANVLGVLGTGIDLSGFVKDVVDFPQAGVEDMFVDATGALQAHRDTALIDFHSLTNAIQNKKTIYTLIDDVADRQALKDMMSQVTSGDVQVRSRFMQVEGREVLVGVGYLDGLGWYNVAFMDVDRIIDRSLFVPIGLMLAGVMIAAALLISFLFKRSVLDRLARVESGVVAVQEGNFASVRPDRGKDEIGRLSRAFSSMAASVSDNTQMLELLVKERTEELEALAYLDQLTAIANRRGFIEGFGRISEAAAKSEVRLAMLLIDIDRFKEINDNFGHQCGDLVVVEIASRIGAVIRPSDLCGRWGGDEFIVLLNDLGTRGLKPIADAVKRGLSRPVTLPDGRIVPVTVSIGACLAEQAEAIERVVDMADAALYRAKAEGRDRVVVFDINRDADAQLNRA